jgi:integrase
VKTELTSKLVTELQLPAGKGEEIYWDTRRPGLGLRLRRGASGDTLRIWIAQRKKHGRAHKVRLGKATEIRIDAAREAARKVLAKIDLGEDPVAERRAAATRDQRTMSALVADYLAHKERRVRPRTFVEISRYLTGAYFKALHNRPIDSILRGDVSKCVMAIERERGSGTAREARQCLSGFYTWLLTMGLAEANPVINSATPADIAARDRVLTEPELAAIWNACNGDDYGRVVKLLILTGARRREIGDMAWSEINTERGTFTIPATRSKNGREHVLPLAPPALDIIKGAPRMVSRDYVFGVRGPNGFTMWGEGKLALDRRLGDSVEPWRIHDIRRTVATVMSEKLDILPHVVEAVLNHQSGHKAGVAGVYNRAKYAAEVKRALALWADYVTALVDGAERKIVQFSVT